MTIVRRQRVQALTVCGRPLRTMCRCCRFRLNLRLVCRFEYETRLPYCGFLPQISQRAAIRSHPFTIRSDARLSARLSAHAHLRAVMLRLFYVLYRHARVCSIMRTPRPNISRRKTAHPASITWRATWSQLASPMGAAAGSRKVLAWTLPRRVGA